jgi:hypothetical protein
MAAANGLIGAYLAEATSGHYDDLLVTTMHWVDVQ